MKDMMILKIVNIVVFLSFLFLVYYLYYYGMLCPQSLSAEAECIAAAKEGLKMCYLTYIIIEVIYFIIYKFKALKILLALGLVNLVVFGYLFIEEATIVLGDLFIEPYTIIYALPLVNLAIECYIIKKERK